MKRPVLLSVVGGVFALGLLVASLRGGDPAEFGPTPSPASNSSTARDPARVSGPAAEVVTSPRPAYPARLDASPGERFRYRLDASWTAHLERASGASDLGWEIGSGLPPSVATRLQGQLDVTVLARGQDEFLLRCVVSDALANVRAGAEVQPFELAHLRQPVLVRFSSEGRALGYSFEPGVPGHVQGLLIGAFAASHQFVVRDRTTPWIVRGLRDEIGEFSAEFAWAGPATLHRSITRYRSDVGQSVDRSAAHVTLADGWIASSQAREKRVAEVEGLFVARTAVDVHLQLVDRAVVSLDGVPLEKTRTWQTAPIDDRSTAPLPEEYEQNEAHTVEDPVAELENLVAEIAAITDTEDLYGSAGHDAWRRLADLARAHPDEAVPLMADLVRTGELEAASQNWILSALGLAGGEGSSEATKALADLIDAPGLPTDLRMSALIAAHQLDGNVTPEMIEIVLDVLLDDVEPESPLPTTAALLLGDFAAQTGLPGESRALIDAGLELVRESSFGRDEPEVYFEALRNSNRADLIERSFEYLDHEDPSVRRAAVEALGGMPESSEAHEGLVNAATSDPSADVRATALDSLAGTPATPEVADTLREVVRRDADPAVQARAVDALRVHANQGSPDAYAALVDLAARGEGEAAEGARSALSDLDESRSASEAGEVGRADDEA